MYQVSDSSWNFVEGFIYTLMNFTSMSALKQVSCSVVYQFNESSLQSAQDLKSFGVSPQSRTPVRQVEDAVSTRLQPCTSQPLSLCQRRSFDVYDNLTPQIVPFDLQSCCHITELEKSVCLLNSISSCVPPNHRLPLRRFLVHEKPTPIWDLAKKSKGVFPSTPR